MGTLLEAVRKGTPAERTAIFAELLRDSHDLDRLTEVKDGTVVRGFYIPLVMNGPPPPPLTAAERAEYDRRRADPDEFLDLDAVIDRGLRGQRMSDL